MTSIRLSRRYALQNIRTLASTDKVYLFVQRFCVNIHIQLTLVYLAKKCQELDIYALKSSSTNFTIFCLFKCSKCRFQFNELRPCT